MVKLDQKEPAVNWLVFHSDEGYANVVKMKKQTQEIISSCIPTISL